MQLSMNWLADYTDVSDISIKEYCDRMTMSGSKVEGYETICGDISGVVCGKILEISRPLTPKDSLYVRWTSAETNPFR